MNLSKLILVVFLFNFCSCNEKKSKSFVDELKLKTYVEQFNAEDEELYSNINNDEAYNFLKQNIPLFECPDINFERTYYFRWWTYRKHIKNTKDGYVVTEFLPVVKVNNKFIVQKFYYLK